MESAFQAVQNAFPKLENRVIEFLADWLVALLALARHVLETRSPHLSFMLLKEYWFRELYLGLKVTASFDIFVPAWMIPPMYHSLRRESVKSTDSGSVTGVKSIRPTWFQDTTATRGPPPSSEQGTPEPMHGLRLMIKEEALIISDQPSFPAVTELAKRGLLSAETWQCNRPRVSLKTSIDVPMLGDIIEQNGDGFLEESHMPVGRPLHIDGAVRQRCIHRDTTLQELDDLLSEYDMKRDLAEINRKAPQWSHKAGWNKWYVEPKAGLTLRMWINAEANITQKTSREMKSGTATYAV